MYCRGHHAAKRFNLIGAGRVDFGDTTFRCHAPSGDASRKPKLRLHIAGYNARGLTCLPLHTDHLLQRVQDLGQVALIGHHGINILVGTRYLVHNPVVFPADHTFSLQ